MNEVDEKEQLFYEKHRLLEKRAALQDCWFLYFRPDKIKEINRIEQKIEYIEEKIISIQQQEREKIIAKTKKVIFDTEELLSTLDEKS